MHRLFQEFVLFISNNNQLFHLNIIFLRSIFLFFTFFSEIIPSSFSKDIFHIFINTTQ